MALYERVVKRAAINRERAHPGLTLEPSSLPAALLAAACCCSPLAFLMTSLMASLIASLTTPLIPPLISSLITYGLSDGLSDALVRGTHPLLIRGPPSSLAVTHRSMSRERESLAEGHDNPR